MKSRTMVVNLSLFDEDIRTPSTRTTGRRSPPPASSRHAFVGSFGRFDEETNRGRLTNWGPPGPRLHGVGTPAPRVRRASRLRTLCSLDRLVFSDGHGVIILVTQSGHEGLDGDQEVQEQGFPFAARRRCLCGLIESLRPSWLQVASAGVWPTTSSSSDS